MKTKKIFLNLLVTSTLLSVAAPLVSGKVEADVVSTRDSSRSPLISAEVGLDAGGFRLYFDANYQMGYRYNRKPKFDKETGEILADK